MSPSNVIDLSTVSLEDLQAALAAKEAEKQAEKQKKAGEAQEKQDETQAAEEPAREQPEGAVAEGEREREQMVDLQQRQTADRRPEGRQKGDTHQVAVARQDTGLGVREGVSDRERLCLYGEEGGERGARRGERGSERHTKY